MIRRYCEVWHGWWRICRVDLGGRGQDPLGLYPRLDGRRGWCGGIASRRPIQSEISPEDAFLPWWSRIERI
ncbi:hypothetical protein DY000_02031900 [Brassica cretica]|uniref:Uncharacterized protein n=1 Tax=Brassica cretica TaxID=69181 RepID=A0ABQ7DU85_BRACR|nr:hypothetical protein DY000_02031900 [Brassica cretica]